MTDLYSVCHYLLWKVYSIYKLFSSNHLPWDCFLIFVVLQSFAKFHIFKCWHWIPQPSLGILYRRQVPGQVLMFLLLPISITPELAKKSQSNKIIAEIPVIWTWPWTVLKSCCLGRVFLKIISVQIYVNISLYFMLIHLCNFLAWQFYHITDYLSYDKVVFLQILSGGIAHVE